MSSSGRAASLDDPRRGATMFGGAFRGRRVLVTGHTGFKGSWLARWLLDLGAEVYGYALEPDTSPALWNDLELAELVDETVADIRDRDVLLRVVDRVRPEIVFHLAAQPLVRRSYAEPLYTYETNVLGTAYLLEAVRARDSTCAIVVVTSDKVYENRESGRLYSEDDCLGGADPYSSSKACAELVTAAYRRSFFEQADVVRVGSARAGNVIGGGDWAEDRIVPDCIRALVAGEQVVVRNPDAVRPWQHVLEPLSGYLLLASRLWSGDSLSEAFNFGPPPSADVPVRELVSRVIDVWGGGSWESTEQDRQPHEARLLRLDIAKSEERLGWRPLWTAEDAIARTVDWYRAYAAESRTAESLVAADIAAYTRACISASAVWADAPRG